MVAPVPKRDLRRSTDVWRYAWRDGSVTASLTYTVRSRHSVYARPAPVLRDSPSIPSEFYSQRILFPAKGAEREQQRRDHPHRQRERVGPHGRQIGAVVDN